MTSIGNRCVVALDPLAALIIRERSWRACTHCSSDLPILVATYLVNEIYTTEGINEEYALHSRLKRRFIVNGVNPEVSSRLAWQCTPAARRDQHTTP